MRNNQQLKSEKITERLREQLYRSYWSKHQKQQESSSTYNIISDAITESYLKEYFDNEEEIKLFHKYKNAFNLSHVVISPKDFGINLEAMGIHEKRHRGYTTYNVTINNVPPMHTKWENIENMLKDVLGNQGIRESIINLTKDYVRSVHYNDTICDKYLIGMPQNFWRECEYFCKDCKTTLQLKTKYPEIYELYLETVPFLLNKEERINNLRSKLGFI